MQQQPVESESQEQPSEEKQHTPIVETIKEEQEAGWPSFGQLLIDLSKLALEALASVLLYFTPFRFRDKSSKNGLTPLKDSLIMPEDEPKPPSVQKHRTPPPLSETRQAHPPNATDKYSEMKAPKLRSSSFKDPSLSSKHRSSKRQELADFYGSGEAPPPPYGRSKSNKDRSKHRQRDKSGEVEPKPVDTQAVNYDDAKFGHYNNNMRSKYSDSYRYE